MQCFGAVFPVIVVQCSVAVCQYSVSALFWHSVSCSVSVQCFIAALPQCFGECFSAVVLAQGFDSILMQCVSAVFWCSASNDCVSVQCYGDAQKASILLKRDDVNCQRAVWVSPPPPDLC